MHYLTAHYLILLAALVFAVIAALDLTTKMLQMIAAAIAFFLLSMFVTGCAGGLHGNVHANVTGNVADPSNAQFDVGAQTNFAKRHNSSGK